jgi:hypothetical protein
MFSTYTHHEYKGKADPLQFLLQLGAATGEFGWAPSRRPVFTHVVR